MDNVNFEAKTTWVQDEIVYPADANRWEKGIKDCTDLVNDHNARIPELENSLPKKVNKAGDTMTGRLTLSNGGEIYLVNSSGKSMHITTNGTNWDLRGDATWLRFSPDQFGLTLRDVLGGQDFFKLLDTKTVKDYIVDRYSDEEGNWYEVYASGWLKQGGTKTATSEGDVITFLKPFASTNYKFWSSCKTGDSDNTARTFAEVLSYPRTNTSIHIKSLPYFAQTQGDWFAEGKGDKNYV